ncbi:MAG: hypothetical protein SGILL_004512 [Bacillariaceae sp.]
MAPTALLVLILQVGHLYCLAHSMSYSSSSSNGRGRGGGRGQYYKNKYGNGRGGRGGRSGGGQQQQQQDNGFVAKGGGSYSDLQRLLQRLDGKPYGAYHDLDTPMNRGWVHPNFGLFVSRAQSDPFAPPTKCRIIVDASKANFPRELYANRTRAMALADFLLRHLYETCKQLGADDSLRQGGGGWSGPKGGDLQVMQPCQHILEQSAVRIDRHGNVIAQFTVNLPARGRTILGRAAETIFGNTVPAMAERSLFYSSLPGDKLKAHVEFVEDQVWLQHQLDTRNLVAFVPNGAVLPRRSGADDLPMDKKSVVLFQSPKRLQITFSLPNAGIEMTGMGIPKGITLICGGGYHGKSTLLQALQFGIYPKIAGDGREFCMVSSSAYKIRAEDGRNVKAVDISNFISNLPFERDTKNFFTADASGNTCATNFMVRDSLMTQLVSKANEPITPLLHTVRGLYDDCGVSSVLVIGGTGEYFGVADNVIVLESYTVVDATEKAKMIIASADSQASFTKVPFIPTTRTRGIAGDSFAPGGKVKTMSKDSVSYGGVELDLRCVEQLVTKSQTMAIANILQHLPVIAKDGKPLKDVLKEIDGRIDEDGLESFTHGQCNGSMSRPRSCEIAAAINRLRIDNSVIQRAKPGEVRDV